MTFLIAIFAVIGIAAALLWLLSYGLTVIVPLALAVALYVLLETVCEHVEPKWRGLFKGGTGLAIFVIILAWVVL